jgi:protein-L-isoaspartate(D-aspartate) O-methyltransferase
MRASEPVESFAAERAAMVENQLRKRGIHATRVLDAMALLPRERFVPEAVRDAAYGDHALSIGEAQTISQPYMVARACELAELQPAERALEVGGGSGYQAAVLAQLCEHVTSLELIESLALRAAETLRELGIHNVSMLAADGTRGYPERAPYDAIVVAAGSPSVPEALIDQLAMHGRLVIPLGADYLQTLTVLRKTEHGMVHEDHDGCVYVPLRGGGGWTDRDAGSD